MVIVFQKTPTGLSIILKVCLPALGTLLLLLLLACSDMKTNASKVRKEKVVPVMVTVVEEKTVPVQLTAIGNVEAYATVAVKSRITGELKQVHFQEGQDVTRGALLFTIDSAPYEADLKRALANLARSQALAKKAEEDLRRYADLVKKEYISQEQYDQVSTNLEALRAQIKADQAAVETTRLQVSYCSIYAPITGRTGILLADKGNMIRANDEKAMVVINQIQPVYVTFSLPEQSLSEIKKYSAGGKLKIKALLSKEEEHPEEGWLSFIDNTVDKTTGTIRLRGTFPNQGKRLWPGGFVNLILGLTSQPNALVIPTQAIQTGLEGQYVYVVKPDLKAENRPVKSGRSLDGLTVIEKGLQGGEMIVIDGQFQLSPGTKVQIKKGLEGKGVVRS
ncbi:MAG: efflux RND transporter periplasmic adaptor subunit [Deltaproteobacteria bacterium]|nr:efflux RND transporter periplasmic adaptor subunit [Deltaproteobacteria bacterium]